MLLTSCGRAEEGDREDIVLGGMLLTTSGDSEDICKSPDLGAGNIHHELFLTDLPVL